MSQRTRCAALPTDRSAYLPAGTIRKAHKPNIPHIHVRLGHGGKGKNVKPHAWVECALKIKKKKYTFKTGSLPLYIAAIFSCIISEQIYRLGGPRSTFKFPADIEKIALDTLNDMDDPTPEKIKELSRRYKQIKGAVEFQGVAFDHTADAYRAFITTNGETTRIRNPATKKTLFSTAEEAARAWDEEARSRGFGTAFDRNFPTEAEKAERAAVGSLVLQ